MWLIGFIKFFLAKILSYYARVIQSQPSQELLYENEFIRICGNGRKRVIACE